VEGMELEKGPPDLGEQIPKRSTRPLVTLAGMRPK